MGSTAANCSFKLIAVNTNKQQQQDFDLVLSHPHPWCRDEFGATLKTCLDCNITQCECCFHDLPICAFCFYNVPGTYMGDDLVAPRSRFPELFNEADISSRLASFASSLELSDDGVGDQFTSDLESFCAERDSVQLENEEPGEFSDVLSSGSVEAQGRSELVFEMFFDEAMWRWRNGWRVRATNWSDQMIRAGFLMLEGMGYGNAVFDTYKLYFVEEMHSCLVECLELELGMRPFESPEVERNWRAHDGPSHLELMGVILSKTTFAIFRRYRRFRRINPIQGAFTVEGDDLHANCVRFQETRRHNFRFSDVDVLYPWLLCNDGNITREMEVTFSVISMNLDFGGLLLNEPLLEGQGLSIELLDPSFSDRPWDETKVVVRGMLRFSEFLSPAHYYSIIPVLIRHMLKDPHNSEIQDVIVEIYDLMEPRVVAQGDSSESPLNLDERARVRRISEMEVATRHIQRFSKYRRPEPQPEFDIYDEETYWNKVEGFNLLKSKGRPQIPKGLRVTNQMWEYHKRVLADYDRERQKMHFNKIYPVYLSNSRLKRFGKGRSEDFARKLKKQMWKRFQQTGSLEAQGLFTMKLGCKRRAKGLYLPELVLEANPNQIGAVTSQAVSSLRGQSNEIGRELASGALEQAEVVGNNLIQNAADTVKQTIGDVSNQAGYGFADGIVRRVREEAERMFGTGNSAMLKVVNTALTVFLVITDPDIEWALKGAILIEILQIENTLLQTLQSLLLAKTTYSRFSKRRVVEEVTEPEVIEAQGSEEDSGVVNALFTVFGRLIGATDAINLPGSKVAKFLVLWGNAAKGLEHLVTFVLKGLKWVVNYFYEKIYGVPWLPAQSLEFYEKIKSWNEIRIQFELKERLGEATANTYRMFLIQWKDIYQPLHKVVSTVNEPAIKIYWADVERKTALLYQRARESVAQVGKRNRPVGVLFCGSTAQGKSTILRSLCCLIAERIGYPYERPGELIYARNRNEEYWSGYKDQLFVAIDEFLSADDKEATQKECDDLLSIVNDFDFTLNMAALEDKGKVFTSRFVLATSNIGRTTTKSVDEMERTLESFSGPQSVTAAMRAPEAVFGRFGKHIYRVRMINKIPRVKGVDPSDLASQAIDAWAFDRYDYVVDESRKVTFLKKETLNMLQVARRLVQDYEMQESTLAAALCDRSTLHAIQERWDVEEEESGAGVVAQGLWSDAMSYIRGESRMKAVIDDRRAHFHRVGVRVPPGTVDAERDPLTWLSAVRHMLLTDIGPYPMREHLAGYNGDVIEVLRDLSHLVVESRVEGATAADNRVSDAYFLGSCIAAYEDKLAYRLFVTGLIDRMESALGYIRTQAANAQQAAGQIFQRFRPAIIFTVSYFAFVVLWLKLLQWMFPPEPIKVMMVAVERQGFTGLYKGKQGEDRRNVTHSSGYVPSGHKGRIVGSTPVQAQVSTTLDTDQDPGLRNIVKIAVTIPGDKKMGMYAVFVHNNVLMIPAHFWNPVLVHGKEGVQPNYEVWSNSLLEMSGSFGRFECSLNEIDPRTLWISDEQDVSFIDLSSLKAAHTRDWHFNTPPSLRRYFVTEPDLVHSLNHVGGAAILKPSDDWSTMNKLTATAHMLRNVGKVDFHYKVGDAIYAPPMLEVHGLETLQGECGLPYVATTGPRRFIGFHVARVTGVSKTFGSVITRQLLDTALTELGSIEGDITGQAVEIVSQGALMVRDIVSLWPERIRVIGEVPSAGGGGGSKLIQTRLHPDQCPESLSRLGPSTMAPARLTRFVNDDGEMVSPMERAVRTFEPRPSNLTIEEVMRAADGIHLQFPPMRERGVRPMVLNIQQAIVGVPYNRYIRSVEMRTSCGYTYNTKYKNFGDSARKGKLRFFEIEEHPEGNRAIFIRDSNGFSPFLHEYGKLCARYLQGLPGNIPNVGTLKDEKRKLKKVEAGDSRLFSVSEMHAQILMKQIFASLMAAVAAAHDTSEPKVGTNPYSHDWDNLYYYFRTFERLFAGDYKWFDKSHQEYMMMGCFAIFRAWFETYGIHDEFFMESLHAVLVEMEAYAQTHLPANWEDLRGSDVEVLWRILKAIFYDSCYCIHVLFGLLVMIIGALPSGHALTTLINCLINMMIFRINFYRQYPSGYRFEDHARLGVVGDDNGVSVDPKLNAFNCITMAATCADIGYVYTDYAKELVARAFHDIHEIEFNKRKFVPRGDKIYAPLNWETLREILYWRHKSLPEEIALGETLRSFFIELYQYPKEEYDRIRNDVIVLLQKQYPLHITTLMESIPTYYKVASELELNAYAPRMWGTRPYIPCLRDVVGGETQQESPTANLDVEKVEAHTVVAQGHYSRIIQGLMQSEETIHETVAFVDDAPVQTVESIITPTSLRDLDPFPKQDMRQILSRMYQLDTFAWSSADAAGTVKACYRFPEALFTETNVWQKLLRFDLLRGGVRVVLRINATKFHYGTLLISWLPYYDPTNMSAGGVSGEFTSKFGDLYSQGQNPSVIMSAASSASVEFVIPGRRPHPWVHIDRYKSGLLNMGCMGCVVIRVLTPLGLVSSVTTPTVDVTMFAAFEDPEVAGMQNENRTAYTATVNVAGSVIAQGKTTAEAREKSSEHLISGTALSVGKFLGGVSQWPVVGGAAGAAGKVFTFLGAGARSIGLDKPTTVESATITTPRIGQDLAQARGLDSSMRLCLDPENRISADPTLIKSADDETSIRGFSRRLFLLDTTSFDGSSAVGTRVCNIPVTPQLCHAYVSSGAYKVRPTPPALVGSCCRNWRGSMKYCIRFVCSSYTTCRVRIGFHPDPANTPTTLTSGTADFPNVVYDINGDTTVCFTIPYLGPALWKHANYLIPYASGTTFATVPDSFANGMVTVSIVNPVRTSENTNDSTVYMIVMQTVGEDMQFAAPAAPVNFGALVGDVVAQGREEPAGPDTLINVGIFPGIVPVSFSGDSGICMGEIIDDVRDLLKRYCYVKDLTITAAQWNQASDAGGALYSPITNTLDTSSVIGLIASCYMFVRGSYRNKFIADSGEVISATLGNSQDGFTFYNTPNFTYRMGWPGSGVARKSFGGELSVEVPYYTPWICEIPKVCTSGASAGNYMGQRYVIVGAPTTNAVVHCFESFGDDVDLGTLSAPPAVWLASAALPNQTPGAYPY